MVKMDIKDFIVVFVKDKYLAREPRAKKWCAIPYKGHKRGCPNILESTQSCKGNIMIDDIGEPPWFFICAVCDFKKYREDMKKLHPKWTERQLRNPLYWQGNIRKRLDEKIEEVFNPNGLNAWVVERVPEGYGINVMQTLWSLGHDIPKYPDEEVWKVHLIYQRKKHNEG